ncbi:MAG: hypothetical protein KBA61_09260, partial [Spirochaetes bacterium]|nr:hypothetical protein [Spirochaetota bacterium]
MKKALFLAAILFLGVSTAHANFADTYGLGAKGASIGSAMTALADDWSSAYTTWPDWGDARRWSHSPKSNRPAPNS